LSRLKSSSGSPRRGWVVGGCGLGSFWPPQRHPRPLPGAFARLRWGPGQVAGGRRPGFPSSSVLACCLPWATGPQTPSGPAPSEEAAGRDPVQRQGRGGRQDPKELPTGVRGGRGLPGRGGWVALAVAGGGGRGPGGCDARASRRPPPGGGKRDC